MQPLSQSLLHLLSDRDVTFFIPPYQRNYEWDESQCEAFWDDVLNTYKKNRAGDATEHFFGTLTYFRSPSAFGEPDKLVLIDGQQRITTTMLFLIAVRDLLSDDKKKDFIDADYLQNRKSSGDDDEYKVKLKQVETDWPAFKKLALGEDLDWNDKNSAVYRNYFFFRRKLKAAQSALDGELTDLVQHGLGKFSVITIELEVKNPWENPQEIFESMNSLGKPLSLADLVRNYLLMGKNPDEQERLYRDYWLKVERVLPPGTVSDFIRDYMQLRGKKSCSKATMNNAKNLYREFKISVKAAELSAETVFGEFAELAPLYAEILSGCLPGHPELGRELQDFRIVKADTANSFLLGLLEQWTLGKFADAELSEILDAFRIYIVRRRILGLGQAENKDFPKLVSKMDDLIGAKDKRQMMFEILSRQQYNLRVPTDDELRVKLKDFNFYNFAYKKYILSLIEEKWTKSRPDMEDGFLQVEHIMPRTLSDVWKAELGENAETVHEELLDNIGNLTLIRHNQELGNKSFAEKKEVYKNNAGLQIAKTFITDREKWDAESIRNRSKEIVDILLKEALPIPENLRKGFNYSQKPRGFSFEYLNLVGETIRFIEAPQFAAKAVSDDEVEFEGKRWKLTPLTRELKRRLGTQTPSEAYQGSLFFMYEGEKLANLWEKA